MGKCIKCGSELKEGLKFCLKCGQPTNLTPPANPQAATPRPMRPQPLKAAPVQPQQNIQPRPMRPQPVTTPQQPVSTPQQPADKGFITNAVRTVANAVTFGAMNRDIAREQEAAVRQERREAQGDVNEAREAQQRAEQAQVRAERDAERAADSRAMELVDGIDVVRGRAIWNIQSGEIARRISERELEEVEKLKGIIVQEGCSAIIFANGELVSTLSSGAYLFYKSLEEEQAALKAAVEKAEKELSDQERRVRDQKRQQSPTFRQLGIVGEIGRGFRWLGRVIMGEKKNEVKEKQKQRKIDYARLLSRLTQAPVLSVYIVSNRYITMTFGGQVNTEGGIDFVPYKIPTRILDVEVGVSLQLKVSDIHAFATNYLADRSRADVSMFQQMLNGNIETLIRQTLRNMDYERTGLSPDVVNDLKVNIQRFIGQQLHGLECVQVQQITDSNADFERFRSVERELFNTEKELEYLQRTGEFRNRLENETNSQQIQSSQNAEQLRYALQQINKDGLLHDDELEEFVQLLESQKRIREAKTQEEEFEALEDLRKNRLVKQDEMEELEHQLAQNKIPREELTQIMRIQSQQKVEEERMHAEWALGDQRQDHDWEREDLERRRNWGIEDEERERQWMREEQEYNRDFGRRQQEDEYEWQKHLREEQERRENEQVAYERSRQEKFDEDQLEANRSQRQIDKLQAMAEMQAKLDAQQLQHEENLASLRTQEQINRDNQFAGMTAEQIRAAQLSHLTGDAQVAMANAYNGEKEAEMLREAAQQKEDLMRQMMNQQNENSDKMMERMMQMAGMIKDTATGISGAQQQMQQQRIDQLQQDNQRQQQRVDHVQDVAMQNVSQVSTAAASNPNAFGGSVQQQPPQATPATPAAQPQLIECECYQCHQIIKIAEGTPNCPVCGAPFQW